MGVCAYPRKRRRAATAEKNRSDGQHFVARTENLRTRLKGGKGKILIDRMLANKIDQAKTAIASIERQKAVRERALALIEDASFAPEQAPGFASNDTMRYGVYAPASSIRV